VLLQGTRIETRPPRAIAALGVARTFQHVRLRPTMTCLENVATGAWLRGRSGVLAGRVPWYPTRDTPQQSSELTADKVAS